MSIKIDEDKCIGCRKCVNICPGNIIDTKGDGKAEIKEGDLCWGCAACLKECGHDAIIYFLGTDIGGDGGVMKVNKLGSSSKWIFEKDNKIEEFITIDSESNKY